MQVIETSRGRTFHFMEQAAPACLPHLPFTGTSFPCLLWDAEGGRTPDQRHALVTSLMNQGCRYFVCGGSEASQWEDAADEAFVMLTLDCTDAERERCFVMTTAHEGESMDDVAFFFVFNTNFDMHAFADFLILTIGADAALVARLAAAVRDADASRDEG